MLKECHACRGDTVARKQRPESGLTICPPAVRKLGLRQKQSSRSLACELATCTSRNAEGLLHDDVATRRPHRDGDCIRQFIDAGQHLLAGVIVKKQLFCHVLVPRSDGFGVLGGRQNRVQ